MKLLSIPTRHILQRFVPSHDEYEARPCQRDVLDMSLLQLIYRLVAKCKAVMVSMNLGGFCILVLGK